MAKVGIFCFIRLTALEITTQHHGKLSRFTQWQRVYVEYKNDEDRLAKLKKINTAITSYNKVAAKNYKECISKLSPDGKISGLLSHWLKVRFLPGVHDEKTILLS